MEMISVLSRGIVEVLVGKRIRVPAEAEALPVRDERRRC